MKGYLCFSSWFYTRAIQAALSGLSRYKIRTRVVRKVADGGIQRESEGKEPEVDVIQMYYMHV